MTRVLIEISSAVGGIILNILTVMNKIALDYIATEASDGAL